MILYKHKYTEYYLIVLKDSQSDCKCKLLYNDYKGGMFDSVGTISVWRKYILNKYFDIDNLDGTKMSIKLEILKNV